MGDTRDPETDQPLPTPGQVCVQDWAIEHIRAYVAADKNKYALALAFQDRKDHGIRKYGRPLETHNGRDALRDLWEELVDAYVYAVQIELEKDRDPRASMRFQRIESLLWSVTIERLDRGDVL